MSIMINELIYVQPLAVSWAIYTILHSHRFISDERFTEHVQFITILKENGLTHAAISVSGVKRP
jgi:hypothetical protein